MNDVQEDKVGMYDKVDSFLSREAATLSVVTQIAGLKTQLHNNIIAILDCEGDASADYTGFTEQKTRERNELESITLKIARALAAYWRSTNTEPALLMEQYLPSELEGARDNDLYASAKRLHAKAAPVAASLTAFNSGPADIADINTKKEAFFDSIPVPVVKRNFRKDSGEEIERLMKETDKLLEELDVYLDTFAAVNEQLYQLYRNARSIDHSGGAGARERTGTIDGSALENPDFRRRRITAKTIFEIRNMSDKGSMLFYFAAGKLAAPSGPSVEVEARKKVRVFASELGNSPTKKFLTILNKDEKEGKWKVKIIAHPQVV